MTDTIDAVVAGHICLDIIPKLRDTGMVFQPGQLVETGPAVVATGGAVSNTGLALHILGIRTRLMAKTGDDPFGHAIREIVPAYAEELADGMTVVPGEQPVHAGAGSVGAGPGRAAAVAGASRRPEPAHAASPPGLRFASVLIAGKSGVGATS